MKVTKVCLFVILFAGSGFAQSNVQSQIDDLISKYNEYGLFNGTALVAVGDQIILENGYGLANKEFDIPNSPEVKFRIGSISKQFTATIILQLVDEGKISLDGKITDYLKDYRKDTGDKVTIHHLLTHTSGITSYTNLPNVWSDSLRNHYNKDYFIKHFHSSDLESNPGEQFNYNNTGYYLLAAIAEEVTGKSFSYLLNKRIFEPVNMTNTGTDNSLNIIPNLATGYLKQGLDYVRDPYIYMPNAMGAGQLYSTVGDLYKWNLELYTEDILNNSLKEKMFTPFKSNYAYGWLVFKIYDDITGDSLTVTTHGGGINGFNTLIYRTLEDKGFVALFNNTGNANLMEMTTKIRDIIAGKETAFPQKPIGDFLNEIILEDGIETAISTYKQLKEEEADNFDFSEPQLNLLGYSFLRQQKLKEAYELLKLNAEVFPKSSNVYDSYGEVLLAMGDTLLSIENYKKSIELNPANETAKKLLVELGVKDLESEITIPNELLKKYSGKFNLFPNFDVVIRTENGKLFAQATSQPEFQIFPMSESKFYYKVVNAQIEFVWDEENQYYEMILFQAGREIKGSRIK